MDYQHLNEITVKNWYPLPLINKIQNWFWETIWFTTLDQWEAYHQIWIKEGHEWKTVFWTRYKLYEYLIMPFRLINAPASQQALLNYVLQDYLNHFVVVYLNNIVVFTKKTKHNHTEKVNKVLQKLKEYNLLLKLLKCEFYRKSINFLEHIISTEEIQIDSIKINAIL